jgi:hypothetical protein
VNPLRGSDESPELRALETLRCFGADHCNREWTRIDANEEGF